MNSSIKPEPERSLDWTTAEAREFGDAAVDIWTELLDRLHDDLPVARNRTVPEVRSTVLRDVPTEPLPLDELVEHLRTVVFHESMYPGHPGFIAYVTGAGTVPGAAAELIAAGLNQNTGGWHISPAASEIEAHLMRWFAARLGMPDGSTGFVTSGGAMANLIALSVARTRRAGWNVREEGLRAGPQLTVYVSSQVHDTVDRAVQLLGIGNMGIRHIPVDAAFRMDVSALRETIADDLESGYRPIAVVGTAGTTATGAIDPLDAIADVCDDHDLWFHVDAAYGGSAALTDRLHHLFVGIERADSVGFDPHKWLYTPLVGACILVRDPSALADTFAVDPSYLVADDDLTGRGIDMFMMSPHFSRSFSVLKIWVSLLAHGWDAYERRISHDVALARYLHELVIEHPELEPMTEPSLSVTCFRFVPERLRDVPDTDDYLNALNERIMFELQLGGRVFPSNAVIDGRFALRSCIVNFRTEADTMDELVAETVRLGHRLDDELRNHLPVRT